MGKNYVLSTERCAIFCLTAFLSLFHGGGHLPVTAQNVFDLDEINGDLRIIGDERYDFVGEKDTVVVLDFNDNGINDLFLIRGIDGSVYGFLDISFNEPISSIDTRTEIPDIYIPYNISAFFVFDRLFTEDLNGDGIDDLIISSTYSFTAGNGSAKVFVLYGSANWQSPSIIDLTTEPADLTILYGHPEDVNFGDTLAKGDINNDGIDDLIIGAENGENPNGSFGGSAYVVFGAQDFVPNMTIDFSLESADITFHGGLGNGNFGCDVAAGDVNGDEIDDVIVGALTAELDERGRVYVFFGSDSLPPGHSIDLSYEPADITILGPQLNSRLGRSVTSGDFNGDGLDDICCGGERVLSPSGLDTGGAFLIYGREDFPPTAMIDLAQQSADISCFGAFGESILGLEMKIGDLDNDGLSEWAIFSYTSLSASNREGTVHILYGTSNYPANQIIDFATQHGTVEIVGDDDNDGLSLSGEMTDVNMDGRADLLLGAEGADRDTDRCGEAYVILGRSPLDAPPRFMAGPGPDPGNGIEVRLFNPRSYSSWWSRFEPYPFSGYGVNVASGDLDGDGYDEVITGPGPGPDHQPLVAGFTPEGERLFEYPAYGAPKYGVIVSAGDLDGDGRDEIITGAGPGEVYGPHVRGWQWDGKSTVSPLASASFLAYGTNRWGVNVAAGDIDGDGQDEIITGAGPGAVFGPHVRGWNADGGSAAPIQAVSYFAYGTLRWGVIVACGDIDGDGIDEIVTGPGPSEMFSSHVRAWNYDGEVLASIPGVNFIAYSGFPESMGCVVACGDVDNDRVAEILTAPGPSPDNPAYLKTWNYDGDVLRLVQDRSFLVFEEGDFAAGAYVALGNFYEPADYLP